MAHIVIYRAKNIGVGVGAGSIVAQLVIAAIELLHSLLFVAEYLNNFLPVHHLLDITVYVSQGGLLGNKVLAGVASNFGGYPQNERCCQQYHQRQPYADGEHGAEHRDNRNRRGEHLRNALGDHLPQGIRIVGEMAHGVAEGVRIEILDGQGLHVGKHVITDFLQRALSDNGHDAVIQQRCEYASQIDRSHQAQHPRQAGKIRHRLEKKRLDIVINQRLQETGRHNRGH